MTIEDAQQRVQIQELSGALLKLGSVDGTAASLLIKLCQVVAEEAARTPRFAKSLSAAFAVAPSANTGQVASVAIRKPPVKRVAKKKVPRQPGLFDPFEVLEASGEQVLSDKLTELTIDQLRDIITEQEIDTRGEAARKRSKGPIVAWTVDRVKALATKGSVFR